MSSTDFVKAVLVGAVVGFGAYGLSYAFHVWRARRLSPERESSGKRPWSRTLGSAGKFCLGIGLLLMILAPAFRLTVEREGTLRGEGLYVVQAPYGMVAERVTAAEAVDAGEFLVAFQSMEPMAEGIRQSLRLERDRVQREYLRDRLMWESKSAALKGELARLAGEIDETSASLRLAEERVARARLLYRDRLISEDDYALRHSDLEILEAKFEKLQRWRDEVDLERRNLEAAMGRADGLSWEQLATTDDELSRISGFDVHAPFSGRIVYQASSPRSAFGKEPVMVLAPEGAFRLRSRLPAREVRTLAAFPSVTLEWANGGIRRRFPGRMVASSPLPRDRGYLLAELICEPPDEVIRELVMTRQVVAQLQWAPPVHSLLFFRLGALLALGGAVCVSVLAGSRDRARGASPHERVYTDGPVKPRVH